MLKTKFLIIIYPSSLLKDETTNFYSPKAASIVYFLFLPINKKLKLNWDPFLRFMNFFLSFT